MWLATLVLGLGPVPQAKVAADCDALLARYARAGWSGAALVSRQGEPLIARGYGSADLAGKRPNETPTLFEIASLSKQFTAAAVLKLEEQEKLALDDGIAKWLPGVPEHSRAITIRHLLTHTSGVPRSNASGTGDELEAAVKAYLGTGPKSAPGTRFEYWNGGYALLAGIVERASGTSFTAYCERELFAPAGMRDTGFTGDTDLPAERAAVGRSESGAPRSALEHPYGAFGYQYRGMGGVVTNLLDLLAWDRALAGTSVLGARAKQQFFTPGKDDYACGWYVTKAESGGERQLHGGSVRGFVCEMRRFPAARACVVVLANTDGVRAWELGENLECLLFGRALRYPVPESVALPPAELAACAGVYTCERGRLVVRVDGGALVAGIEGQPLVTEFAPAAAPAWKVDLASLCTESVNLVAAIDRGDVELLHQRMAKRIPADWPERVRKSVYPAYVADHGRLLGVRALGARVAGERVEVVLALEHEHEPGRVKLAFSAAGLEILDWSGPEFPATLRLLPQGARKFSAALGADKPREFEFVRKGARISGLATRGLELRRAD